MNTISLNGYALLELLDFINPDREQSPEQLETEVCVFQMDKTFASSEGDIRPPGVYAYLTDYPDEGILGPLGEPVEKVPMEVQ